MRNLVISAVALIVVATTSPARAAELRATIRDFRQDHPDFEGVTGSERGIVANALGVDDKPVYAGAPTTITTSGRESFDQWYRDVDGVNQRATVLLPLTDIGDGLFEFSSNAFFPIDDQLFGNEGNAHNYHFTTEIHARFTYRGGETFSFAGDDDVFVFINRKLALDLGGVHAEESASVELDAHAEELGLVVGEVYDLDMFHAERHQVDSNFQLTTTLALVDPDEPGVGVPGDGEEPDLGDTGDGFLDFTDDDGDGLPDGCTLEAEGGLQCPADVAIDTDGDGTPDDFDEDRDGDGTADEEDDDRDGDGALDADDDDVDGDGVLDADDADVDGDRVPNVRDDDVDGDGIVDGDDTDVDGDGAANEDDDDADGDGSTKGNDVDDDGDGLLDAQEQADEGAPGPDGDGDVDRGEAPSCGCGTSSPGDGGLALALFAVLYRLRGAAGRRGFTTISCRRR